MVGDGYETEPVTKKQNIEILRGQEATTKRDVIALKHGIGP